MVRQVLVDLWCHLVKLGKACARDVGEIVVFNVVSDVEEQQVQGSVVRMCGQVIGEEVMFTDHVSSHWMWTEACELRQKNEFNQSLNQIFWSK